MTPKNDQDREEQIEPRFDRPAGWREGSFVNSRGAALRTGHLPAQVSPQGRPLAHIVYVMGLSEYAEKTYELAADFNARACSFSVYDRHGQGRSPRLIPGSDRQHSTGVDGSADDLIAFCKTCLPAGEPVILLGHSTGGLIALLALEKEPELFKAAILTAPLFGFGNPILKNREGFFSRLILPKRLAHSYVPGGGPWQRRWPAERNGPDGFSSDPRRNRLHDYWQEKDKTLRAGAPTWQWVVQKCRGIVRIRDAAFLKKIAHPVLVVTGGKDGIVNNKAVADVVAKLPNARHVAYTDARHEILMERDEIRASVLDKDIMPFIRASLKP
jgi:lysophospholipase